MYETTSSYTVTGLTTRKVTAGKQAFGRSSEPEYCLVRRRKSSPNELKIN
jgi:hypothetical protein